MRTFLLFLLTLAYGAVCGAVYLWIVVNDKAFAEIIPGSYSAIVAIILTQILGASIYQAYKKGKTFFDFLKATIPISVTAGVGLLMFNLIRVIIITRGDSPNDPLVLIIFGSLILFLLMSVGSLVISLGINTLIWRYLLPDVHSQNATHSDLLDESIDEKKERWQ